MKDLMLDLETMGNSNNAAILSIGAVAFDLETGKTGEEFHMGINLRSCERYGLSIEADTVLWWLKQSEEARMKIIHQDEYDLAHVLGQFSKFCEDKGYVVWGNSARFDCGILSNAYRQVSIAVPWKHYDEMDVRTLVKFNPEIKKNYEFKGVKHDALDDCKHQIGYCHETWKSLNKQL